jgi:hypothetical protein
MKGLGSPELMTSPKNVRSKLTPATSRLSVRMLDAAVAPPRECLNIATRDAPGTHLRPGMGEGGIEGRESVSRMKDTSFTQTSTSC